MQLVHLIALRSLCDIGILGFSRFVLAESERNPMLLLSRRSQRTGRCSVGYNGQAVYTDRYNSQGVIKGRGSEVVVSKNDEHVCP